MTPEQEAKLPKFAQEELARLRGKLEISMKMLNTELNTEGIQEQDLHVGVRMGFEKLKLYPQDATVKFQVGNHHREHFECYVRKGVLYVFGGDVINLKPQASNVVQIKLEPV